MVLSISPSEEERRAGTVSRDTVELAARHFRTDGMLILENILDANLIAKARSSFLDAYADYLDGQKSDDAFEVSGRRLMITVGLAPPFDDPRLFANSWLWPILNETLNSHFVIDSFGVVCSLPSAPAQPCHNDGGSLFPQSGLDKLLPAAAITVAIPLLEMNNENGTTTFWPGSHRDESRVSDEQVIEPVVREGSCVLWDYRLKHAGTANRSDTPRPLLYITYCRPWWVDHLNFSKQKQTPLRARKRSLQALSEGHQHLFGRAKTF